MEGFTIESLDRWHRFKAIWEYIKKYPVLFGVATFIVIVTVSVPYLGSKIIELAPRPDRELPQSTLAGIVCQNYNQRPIAVMLTSDPAARPLTGIDNAEMVFEMPVTPGGITRLMAVYQCNKPEEIGSIRSARDSFIGLAMGLDAIYAHWGGEQEALTKLNNGVIDNINALIYDGTVFYRKRGVRQPHDGFTSYDLLYDKSVELGYEMTTSFEGYPHLKGKRQIGDERRVVRAYEPPYNVEWFYVEETNTYDRFRAGVPEIDKANNRQVRADVVVVMESTGTPNGIEYFDVDLIGRGNVTIYQNGEEIKGEWVKETEAAPLKFYNPNGEEIPFKPGSIWVEITT